MKTNNTNPNKTKFQRRLGLSRDSLTFRLMVMITVLLLGIIGVKFFWDYQLEKQKADASMLEKAQVVIDQQKVLWDFMAYDTIQYRINYDDATENFTYKGLNCSTVVMAVSDLLAGETRNKGNEYKVKPTNTIYRNVLNKPDDFEVAGVNWLLANPEQEEYYAVVEEKSGKVFRYMRTMRATEDCLTCHGGPAGAVDMAGYVMEGWQIGDFAGTLSLTMPVDTYYENIANNIKSNGLFFLAIVSGCLILIYIFINRIVTRPLSKLEGAVAQVGSGNWQIELDTANARGEIKELNDHFQLMAGQLSDLYQNLESKVELRTQELAQANTILQQHQRDLEEMNLRLSESNVYKSEFLAVMSHELRTPLSSIMAFAEMMLEDMAGQDNKQRRNLEEVLVNSKLLLRLINNILDLAKIEAGKETFNPEIVDINDIAAGVESVIMPLAASKGLFLSVRVEQDVPLTMADSEKLRRIVENLAGNAVKFTEAGGRIDIHYSYDSARQLIVIDMADSGIGIKEEDQRYIFEKFTQADSSSSRKYGGTGLGLTLAKELVEIHDGQIRLVSRPGEGSVFTVEIPLVAVN